MTKKVRNEKEDEFVKLPNQSTYDYVKTHFPGMDDSEIKNILEEESLSQESQKPMMYENKLDKKLTQIMISD